MSGVMQPPRKKKPEPQTEPEPTITYSRSIKLSVPSRAQLNLGHLAELQRQARERGYDDDARVSVLDYRHTGSIYYTLNPCLEIVIRDDR